jgi:AAA+ ATPase superfamily predicted ATPase
MLVGRKVEKEELLSALEAEDSQFIAVYGRRRVGKTYLIRETFNYKFAFQHTGLAKGSLTEQLAEFRESLRQAGMRRPRRPKSWMEAFHMLSDFIAGMSNDGKKVIFIDELPWMDTMRSNLLSALEHFWNGWASARKDIVLIVCGSATAWVQKKILNNYGGLHNRVNIKIRVKPFTLGECELYMQSRNIEISRKQMTTGYMVMGGIPFYWSLINKKWSLDQNIDNLFFRNDGPLHNEFDALYASLFKSPEPYMKVVMALASVRQGMHRDEIIKATKLSDNNIFSEVLRNLEECGFIRKYMAVGKKVRDAFYQLIDNYTLFYTNFIKENKENDEHFWTNNIDTPLRNAWSGLAFERLCLWHVPQIKSALGISGVISSVYSWRAEANEEHPGAQVDLLIDRRDDIINLCEMKYADDEYAFDKEEERKLRNRKTAFKLDTKTRKSVHTTLVTTYGLRKNSHSDIVQSVVTMDDLFRD